MKPSRLPEHLRKVHENKAKKDLSCFQSFRDRFDARPTFQTLMGSKWNYKKLQFNEELKPKFKNGYHSFWLQNKYLTSVLVYGEQ
ncbi:hypothetical protein T4D_16959 [Trichinella pseudospiralis]|uniref:Uncharacterized protein n=1 Tax=Trichinella pseudospiralis TaxID=6337 RepID=A0A0V1FEB8_TRIPS|nr:hypothetical protein T4D_3273 [Trichinella pseudospiralis]KRY89875.1 hypothetical protein T4D_16959 [Trichinella pseudospiralis]